LSPRRAATLIPAVKAASGANAPSSLHSHCTIGLGELVYMDAVDYGLSALQCASGATADGISTSALPARGAELRALGHTPCPSTPRPSPR